VCLTHLVSQIARLIQELVKVNQEKSRTEREALEAQQASTAKYEKLRQQNEDIIKETVSTYCWVFCLFQLNLRMFVQNFGASMPKHYN
jgi:hypothetical protein